MTAPRRSDAALVGVATTTAGVLVLVGDQGWAEWLFGSFMFSCLALLGRLGLDSWRSARAERRRARELEATHPAAAARVAVARERERLASEVDSCIRDSLRQVAIEVERIDETRPVPGLQRVHALTRRTTTELRRQLGLLRDEAAEQPSAAAEADGTITEPGKRRVLAEGAAVVAIAGVESTAYLLTEGPRSLLPWSVLTTTLAAGTVVGHRRRPRVSLLALALVVAGASLLGHPVTSGFWIVITGGVLVWTVAADSASGPRPALLSAAAGLLLVAVVVWAFRRDDPDNLGVLLLVIAVAAAGGLVVAAQRRGRTLASAAARARERQLDDAASDAVRTDRVAVARELHDVVSHAVGVIALQAAAGELSWQHDPGAVRRAVEIIRRTAAETLADLDRLSPVAGGSRHAAEDLVALVERVRAGGTPVDLVVKGGDPTHADVVHRVVQESLTNAMRHAPGAAVVVHVHTDGTHTEVVVEDSGPGPGTTSRRGYGLVGLAERVAHVRGTFESGPGANGRGFRVSASLPLLETLSTK